jgi:uncharacterized membrane protein YsdA (DUF1294 family)
MAFALGYLIGINLFAFAAFAVDKRRARLDGRRLSERSLLALAAIGGSVGAVCAQQLLRHKTRKQPFVAILWSIVVGQTLALAVYFAR